MTKPLVPRKLLERLAPRRALPETITAKGPREIERELGAMTRSYAKNTYAQVLKSTLFAKGCKTNKEPKLRKAREQACTLLGALSRDALAKASLDTLAAAELMFRWNNHKHRDQSLMDGIALARGLPFAIDVQLRTLELGLDADGGYTNAVFVSSAAKGHHWRRDMTDWEPLRAVVCRAAPADYEIARRHAAALRKQLEPLTSAHLAFAFPDEPWATEDLRARLREAPKQADPDSYVRDHAALLGACRDAQTIRQVLALIRRDKTLASRFALDWACGLSEDDALAVLGEALPRLLERPKYGPLHKTPPRHVAEAIASFRDERAAALLAPYFGHAIIGPVVAELFKDAPELLGALEAQARGKSKAAEAAARLLATAKTKRPRGPVASEAEVPALLRARPWRPSKSGAAPIVLALAIPADAEERIELDEREREPKLDPATSVRDMTAGELAKWRSAVKRRQYANADYDVDYKTRTYIRVPEAEGLAAWNDARAFLRDEVAWLARHGVAAIPGFLNRDWIRWLNYSEVGDDPMGILHSIASPRLGPQMARVLARRKKFRREAQAWLLRHPAVAAQGLLPDAFGKPGQARDDAEHAVALLARRGHADALQSAARAYGPKAQAALAALLSRDPLALGVTPPKPPDFLRPVDLPAVLTRSGARLPEDAVDAILELLRVAPLDPPYPGVASLREALDPASLGELARELCEQWVLSGGNGRFEWMLFATAHFPSEDATRRVAALARDWARRDRSKAKRACTTLAAIGSDLALLHLGHIAETSRFDDLRKDARELMDEAAAARGLSRDELEDRVVPDLDLAQDGTLRLSYGPRAFVVSLDEGLRPVVRGEDGALLPTLPRAGKTDDAAAAKAARARFDAFKRDAANVAGRQLRRLEGAMVSGREWPREAFEARLTAHPLLVALVRRLIWEAVDGSGAVAFRVAEDGTLADARDGRITLDGRARVRLLHPARASDDARATWAQLFADYKLAQPFEQIGRAVYAPTSAERGAARVERAAGVKAPATKVLGVLESRGWRRDDRGYVRAYLREARGALLCIPVSPGISMEDLRTAPEQTVGALELRGAAATFGAIDPVDFSEAVRDVVALGA